MSIPSQLQSNYSSDGKLCWRFGKYEFMETVVKITTLVCYKRPRFKRLYRSALSECCNRVYQVTSVIQNKLRKRKKGIETPKYFVFRWQSLATKICHFMRANKIFQSRNLYKNHFLYNWWTLLYCVLRPHAQFGDFQQMHCPWELIFWTDILIEEHGTALPTNYQGKCIL
jgi:hypothetical protein